MEVKVFGGRWTGDDSDIELHEAADGTIRRWHHAGRDISGEEPKFFDGSRNLVFRQCASGETNYCLLYPGT